LDLDIFQREDNEEQLNREIAYAIANIHGFRVSITPEFLSFKSYILSFLCRVVYLRHPKLLIKL
jgi:hypothetical protein